MRDARADAQIASALRLTWQPLFGRFGSLTPTQRASIPAILDGQDLLLCAPTASGKTEAVCAPLVERSLEAVTPTSILYVSPTRALVNDLAERLRPRLALIGVPVVRRTGDHHEPIPNTGAVIVTTPESFDSLLCRGRREPIGHDLASVQAAVLDEVHLLFGSARGEQLRWLLERLRRLRVHAHREGWVRSPSLQVVALSATVPDPSAIARAYLRGGVVVTVGGGRTIEAIAPSTDVPSPEMAIPAYLRTLRQPEKLLVFSPARRRVDELAVLLREEVGPLGYSVHAHHGSLSAGAREHAEAAARTDSKVIICATSTLEIGIDIGDVDLVILDGPAPDVPALLQRIGRGNRRSGRTRVMACSGSSAEAIVQAAMIDAARNGLLGEKETGPQFAVARQQIASYIYQSPRLRRSRGAIHDLIISVEPRLDAEGLVSHLAASGELRADRDDLFLGQSWMDLTTKGEIHSNIEAPRGVQVVDVHSGEVIASQVRDQIGRGLKTGGRLLEVTRWERFQIHVRDATSESRAAGEWSYVSGKWMEGSGQPQAVRAYLGIGPDTWPMVRLEDRTCVFHFGGGRRRAVLEVLLPGFSVNGWYVELPGHGIDKPSRLEAARADEVRAIVSEPNRLDHFDRILARPRANASLPVRERVHEVTEWLALDAEIDAIRGSCWQVIPPGPTNRALVELAGSMRRRR